MKTKVRSARDVGGGPSHIDNLTAVWTLVVTV